MGQQPGGACRTTSKVFPRNTREGVVESRKDVEGENHKGHRPISEVTKENGKGVAGIAVLEISKRLGLFNHEVGIKKEVIKEIRRIGEEVPESVGRRKKVKEVVSPVFF